MGTDMEATLVNGMETMDTVDQDCGEPTVERDLLMPATVLATDMEATLVNGMETTDTVDQDYGEPTVERDLLMPATAMAVVVEDMEVMADTDTERRYSEFILQL